MSEPIIACVKCGYRMHVMESVCMNCIALDEYSKRETRLSYIAEQKRLRQLAQRNAKRDIA